MFFPDGIIEEIQQRADIVEVISSYLPLKKAGNTFKALCPFHQEKTPSFVVNSQKQIFHCFGCGVGGNVFSFLMKQENISFPEAVEILARQTGIDISQVKTGTFDKESSKITTKLYEINEVAASYYQNNLLNKEKGMVAREYLKNRRISDELVSKFRIGYSPSRNSLLDYLQKRGYSEDILIKGGLIIKKENGVCQDRFVNKIIFPLLDPQGRVIGFGSRRLDNQNPKYINSPQTILFNKSRYLYGLNLARQFIREKTIIVEGYLDAIALVQFGMDNVVASLGTALTCEQIRLLKRYTEKCIIIYDGDKAGQEASLRGLELFIEEGVQAGIVQLPVDLDPDDCVRKEGKENFKQRIKEAKNFFDYKLEFLCRKYNKEKAEDLAIIDKEMLSSLCKIGDANLKDAYIKKLSQFAVRNIPTYYREESLHLEMEKITALNKGRRKKEDILFKPNVSSERKEEKILLGLMLTEEEIVSLIRKSLKPDEFRDLSVQKVARFLLSQDKKISISHLIEKLRKEKIENLDSLISSSINQLEEEIEFDKKLAIASGCIKRIKTKKKEDNLLDLQKEIETAEEKGDEVLVSQLLEEYQRVLTREGYQLSGHQVTSK